MRGEHSETGMMFSYISPEARVPKNHPLRKIRPLVLDILKELSPDFTKMYSHEGRPSIPPEQLLCAMLLQVFFGIRSERQLMEQLDYNMLFRWFVGMSMDDKIWSTTVFTKNRDRLATHDILGRFMTALLGHETVKPLLSDDHFSVDGTLIEAWASHKSFQPKKQEGDDSGDGGAAGGSEFHGQKRSNATHESVTDPDSRLYKKGAGKEAKLCYMGHVLMENRHGLAVGGMVTHATGTAERESAEALLAKKKKKHKRITVGADKGYDTKDHVRNLRENNITPHVAQNNKNRRSAIDGRTTRHEGYDISQNIRKRVECIFGWGKQAGTLRKTKHRGLPAVAGDFILNLIGYNLVRIPKIAGL